VPTHRRAKLATAAAVTAGALTLATGLAVAVDLPDQASDTAEQHVADVPDTTTTSTTSTTVATTTTVGTDDVEGQGEGTRPTDTHGYVISNLARSTEPGPDHGATVSAAASDHATTGTVSSADHGPVRARQERRAPAVGRRLTAGSTPRSPRPGGA
jgi:hypothetical protein